MGWDDGLAWGCTCVFDTMGICFWAVLGGVGVFDDVLVYDGDCMGSATVDGREYEVFVS